MRDLEKRISDLERKAGVGEDRISVIVRSFWGPGANGPERCEVAAYRTPDRSWRIEREPGEPDEAFHARAVRLAPRQAGGITVLREELA